MVSISSNHKPRALRSLNASDAVAGTGHLEVHLAEEVFLANDVGDVGDGAIGRGEPATEMPAQVAVIGTPASIMAGNHRKRTPWKTIRSIQ